MPSLYQMVSGIVFSSIPLSSVLLLQLAFSSIVKFQPFQNPLKSEFGLDEQGNRHCMVLRFSVSLINFNLKEEGTVEKLDPANSSVKLVGFCSLRNEVEKRSQLQASWRAGERRKSLKFVFREQMMKASAHADELRWQLEAAEFSEKYKDRSVKFSSGKNVSLQVNAPLNQKFVCRDAINLTLRNPRYKDFVVQLLPVVNQLELQPLATAFGLGNNVFVCERTRKRTLRESFQSRMTVFSGLLLGTASVGMIVGYSVWKQLGAQRDSAQPGVGAAGGSEQAQQRRTQYASMADQG